MARTQKQKCVCVHCGKELVESSFYTSNSMFHIGICRIPYCKQCVEKLYFELYKKYSNQGCITPEKKAVKRMCMVMDVFYKEDVFNSAMRKSQESTMSITPMAQYMRIIQLTQYNRNRETYENTLIQEEQESAIIHSINDISNNIDVDENTITFFGSGFNAEDYEFLKREYNDWTARHECKTKAQEEVFKDICFNRLQNLKALRNGEDTKDITASFQKMLDSGKLQPKQNSGDTMSDNQTFGTLIDKWENERPLPEIDEELRDVDKIALYINIFFKGHLAKMMGLKNGLSNLYSKFMKKYTVDKPEYNSDDNNEALFDAVFGGDLIDEQ